jgi:hypothetical protein
MAMTVSLLWAQPIALSVQYMLCSAFQEPCSYFFSFTEPHDGLSQRNYSNAPIRSFPGFTLAVINM